MNPKILGGGRGGLGELQLRDCRLLAFEIGWRNVVVVHIDSLGHCGRRRFKVTVAIANQVMREGRESLVVRMQQQQLDWLNFCCGRLGQLVYNDPEGSRAATEAHAGHVAGPKTIRYKTKNEQRMQRRN